MPKEAKKLKIKNKAILNIDEIHTFLTVFYQ